MSGPAWGPSRPPQPHRTPRRGMPGWGWALLAVAGALVVALVVWIALARIVGLAVGDGGGDELAAVDLPLGGSVALAAEPTASVERNPWGAGGVEFTDDGGRDEMFWYDADADDCLAAVTTYSDVDAAGLDDAAASEREYQRQQSKISELLEQPGVVALPTSSGGSVELYAYAARNANGLTWWDASRVFTGSGHRIDVEVMCLAVSDFDAVKRSFLDALTIRLEPAPST